VEEEQLKQLKRSGVIFVSGYSLFTLANIANIAMSQDWHGYLFARYLSGCIVYTVGDLLTVGVVIYICNDALRQKKRQEEIMLYKKQRQTVDTSTNSDMDPDEHSSLRNTLKVGSRPKVSNESNSPFSGRNSVRVESLYKFSDSQDLNRKAKDGH
jgi:hypothetical protein